MSNRYLLPFLFALTLIASSCENEIPFNKNENPPKLVMNALINADSINNMLYLNMTGQSAITHVTNATVEIRVNGNLVERPQVAPIVNGEFINVQKRFLITTKFHPGETVRIDAQTDDGAYHAWAELIVPQPPAAIQKVDTITARISDYENHFTNLLRYRITFSDSPGEKNYYRLVLERQATLYARIYEDWHHYRDTVLTRQNTKMISREDIVLTDGHPSMSEDDNNGLYEYADNIYGVFDDSRFAGQSYTMTVYATEPEWPTLFPSYETLRTTLNCYVRILSISETDYRYFKALNLIDSDVYDETLMEPITFASNVNGGLGIVSITTETSTKISLSDKTGDDDN